MELSITSKLQKYINLIKESHLNDLIDFLISKRIIDEHIYITIHNRRESSLKLDEIYKIIETNPNEEQKVVGYLKEIFPDADKVIRDNENFRNCFVRGRFPKLPPNYVKRNVLVDEFKSKLLNLQWNQKLVVHGMMGYGKSCLVNEVLCDIQTMKYFDNNIFWIGIGEHRDTNNLLQHLWRLYETASSIVKKKSSPCPDSLQAVKDLLIQLFLQPRLKNSLIVLDDAYCEDVLPYFDFKCRTVITTQNKNILRGEECAFVEVKTGFSRSESLELFKKSLNIEHDLPKSAEELYDICKGHPMLIALIGSYIRDNSEDAKSNDDIWKYMINMFSKGEYNLNEDEKIEEKIKKCIAKLLSNGLKEYYHDLAIFMPDVNVPPEVLEVLWNKSKFEVRNIMNKLAQKSLVVPFYHNDLKTYIYGIHDIYLNYLKDETKPKTVSLHKKLISEYDRITNENYALLPNDNYTLQYIGYHIFNAEAMHKFDIYFDLKFLEAKIRAVGKEDVLSDMQRYEIYITRNENILKEKLDQYREFIKRCGSNIYSYEKTDIIQFALGEKKDTSVYKEGLKLAQKSEKLYFQLQRPVDEYDRSTIHVKDDITSACFVDTAHRILIGTASGKIKLFYEEYEKEISNFVGHDGPVTRLIVSPDRNFFLSVSIDGTVILWKFAANSARNSSDLSYMLSEKNGSSPKTKQKLWQDIFTSDRGQIKPTKKFELDEKRDFLVCAVFCDKFPEIFRIATGSSQGNVIIWDAATGARLYATGPRGYSISSLVYIISEQNDKVIFACEDSIHIYEFKENILLSTLHNTDNCKYLFFTDNKLIAVAEKSITLWDIVLSRKKWVYPNTDPQKYYVCSTLTDDSSYLVVSTNLKNVYIMNFEERKLVKEFKSKGLPKSLDTFYDEDKSVHILLIGSDKRTLQQCHILPDDKQPKIAGDFCFIPHWKKKCPLTALVSRDNKIQIFSGSVTISETDVIASKVTCTCFSINGQNVIYGLANGEIHMYNLRHKRNTCIDPNKLKKQESVISIQSFPPCGTRYNSISSNGSVDGIDSTFEDRVVAIFKNDIICIYHDNKILSREIYRPLVFLNSYNIVLVDKTCNIFIWDLHTDSYSVVKNANSPLGSVTLSTAAFCHENGYISMVYELEHTYFLEIYTIVDEISVKLLKQIKLDSEAISSCFTCDGSLLAVGMNCGDIMVWNLNNDYHSIRISLHNSCVEELIFSPTMEPILVSRGEVIAWWNLKTFQQKTLPRTRKKVQSLQIMKNTAIDNQLMDISFWSDKKCLEGENYLLSCLNLHGRARCLSASKDFNTFLTVDENGKIYVMEAVAFKCD